ncbi:MAG: glyoxalase/bleomycin resistance protein/dihydroxybiphenyl dioxygenase, partial [Firmicutes bacterium]|nr:glyoxalase/bleomycin resistance protein/dihydroxybiphenyl dioxygenase [Bacillota bacterium]
MRLDHAMQIVRDLDAAVATFRQLGLHVVPGGEHPDWGTHNALCYFDDLTYIELLAIRSEADAIRSDMGGNAHRFLAGGEGIGTAALRSEQITADADAMRDRGVAVTGPVPGSRRRPDGSLLTWQLALPAWPQPFLIAWGDEAPARRADLIARGALAPHPIAPSGLRLERVAWAVTDLAVGAD